MVRTAPCVELTEAEQPQLQALLRRTTIPLRPLQRAHILLGAAAGQENQALAATLKLRPATVGKVRQAIDDFIAVYNPKAHPFVSKSKSTPKNRPVNTLT